MELSFEAQKALRGMDLGDEVSPGFFMKDLGKKTFEPDPNPLQVENKTSRKPLSREQRERVPDKMAANLMDFFMRTLNDDTQINPIRDGIPQCKNHPFNPPKSIGCIHSCVRNNGDLALPVVRDYTLGDVYEWVKALIRLAVRDVEVDKGWTTPTDLTRF